MRYFKFFAVLFAVAVMSFPVSSAIPDNNKIVFEILRNGQSFGTHSLYFTDLEGGKTQVDITIHMHFSVGPITLFRYKHSNTEIWDGDKILSMTSQTDDDGDEYSVTALWKNEMLDVQTSELSYEAPANVYSTSYWNKITLGAGQLLNTQKGQIEDIIVTPVGQAEKNLDWGIITADIYDVQASVPIRVYYDNVSSEWVGLDFSVRGSDITYRRLTPIGATNG